MPQKSLREKCPDTDQKKLRIWKLYTQRIAFLRNLLLMAFITCFISLRKERAASWKFTAKGK